MNRTELIAHLRDLDACNEAIAWIEQTPGELADLWAACQRGDWMIWLLVAVGYDAGTLRHLACDVAEDVLPIYERHYPDDRRPRSAIAVARRYADGEATEEEMYAARDAARAASGAAYHAAARAAAWTAAWAASDAAALTASFASFSYAGWAAAWARQADMVRARVSWADVERAIAALGAQEASAAYALTERGRRLAEALWGRRSDEAAA